MSLTPEEGRRLHVLTLLESRRITTAQAAEALGITPRQVRRLRVTLRNEGPSGLVHGNRERQSPHALAPTLRAQVVTLARGADIFTEHRQPAPGGDSVVKRHG